MRPRLLLLVFAGSLLLVPRLALAVCTPISNCISPVTCTTPTDSQCTQCNSGYFLQDGTQDTCNACTPVANCVSPVTCTTATDSQCGACASGYYEVNSGGQSQCLQCPSVANCTGGQTTCTTPSDSQCTQCNSGYFLQNGTQEPRNT